MSAQTHCSKRVAEETVEITQAEPSDSSAAVHLKGAGSLRDANHSNKSVHNVQQQQNNIHTASNSSEFKRCSQIYLGPHRKKRRPGNPQACPLRLEAGGLWGLWRGAKAGTQQVFIILICTGKPPSVAGVSMVHTGVVPAGFSAALPLTDVSQPSLLDLSS